MTAKRCTDCRYAKGIGYDFWCGEGHTEYEVLGAETNCPYYEYHDWSKGVPTMTPKRFTLFDDGETIIDNESVVDDGEKETYWIVEYVQVVKLVELLNELHEENQKLKKENAELEKFRYSIFKRMGELYEKQ